MVEVKTFTGMAWDDPQEMIQQLTREANDWLNSDPERVLDYMVIPQTTCAVIPPDRPGMSSRMRWLHTITVTMEVTDPDGGLDVGSDEEPQLLERMVGSAMGDGI